MALPASGVISVSDIVSFYNTNSGSSIALSNVSLRGLAASLWANDPDAGHAGGMTASAASSGPVTLGTNFYSWQAKKSTYFYGGYPGYMSIVYDGGIPGTSYGIWQMAGYDSSGTCTATTSGTPSGIPSSPAFTTAGQTYSGSAATPYSPGVAYTFTAGTYYQQVLNPTFTPPACTRVHYY